MGKYFNKVNSTGKKKEIRNSACSCNGWIMADYKAGEPQINQ